MIQWVRLLVLGLALSLTSCSLGKLPDFAPNVPQKPSASYVAGLPSPFPQLKAPESSLRWAEELRIGTAFAQELDFYRAVTNFKSGLAVLPEGMTERQGQLEYSVLLSYYLAGRYGECIEAFEASSLTAAKAQFPGYRNLLILLHDSYQQTDNDLRAQKILTLTDQHSAVLAHDMQLSSALRAGDLDTARDRAELEVFDALETYESQMKSVRTAQVLNAILPGAGYWYVGQKQTAVTALVVNAAFTAASVKFFCDGNYGAGAITASLQVGWYVGGIDGAARAANRYNEQLWEDMAHQQLTDHKLYPILMFQYGF